MCPVVYIHIFFYLFVVTLFLIHHLNNCNFYLKYDTTTTNVTTYNCFGQDTLIGSTNYSLNFGNEISSLLLTPIENSLYNVYYYNYLSNIYNVKTRKYNLKAILPISLLTKLKLNDRTY